VNNVKFHLLLCAGIIVIPPSLETAVETPSEACRLERSGKASGPSADICERIGRRWTMLMRTSPIPGAIRLVDRDGYRGIDTDQSWVLESPLPETRSGDSAYRSRDGLLRYYAENIIPHEAGHRVFAVYIGKLRVWATPNQYGTQLPDWLDEAAAVWMESAVMRRKRVAAIRSSTPLLESLVTLEHPNAELVNSSNGDFRLSTRTVTPPCAKCTWLPDSLRKKYQVMDSGTDAGGRQKTVIWYSDKSPTKTTTFEEREFYPLAYSLLRFIRIRGGVNAVRELISRYQINPRPRVEVLSALPGLPASLPAFEKAWHAFLASMPVEDE
jgi:hypothetical protein